MVNNNFQFLPLLPIKTSLSFFTIFSLSNLKRKFHFLDFCFFYKFTVAVFSVLTYWTFYRSPIHNSRLNPPTHIASSVLVLIISPYPCSSPTASVVSTLNSLDYRLSLSNISIAILGLKCIWQDWKKTGFFFWCIFLLYTIDLTLLAFNLEVKKLIPSW